MDLTEIVEFDVDEGVHGVGSPASGLTFAFIKAEHPDQEFIKAMEEYTAFIKAKYSADQIKALGGKGQAFKNPDGHYSYPIADEEDLKNAIRAVGRGGASHDAIRKYIIRRAKAMGKSSMIPENWSASGSNTKKADYASMDNANAGPNTPTTRGGVDLGSGGANDPGSPAWEQQDADVLIQAGQALAQVIACLQQARDREAIEGVTVDPSDMAQAWDLDDAICSIQCALRTVATMAFGEEAEAMKSLPTKVREETRQTVEYLSQLLGVTSGATSGADLRKENLVEIDQAVLDEAVAKAVAKAEADRKAAKAEKDARKASEQKKLEDGIAKGVQEALAKLGIAPTPAAPGSGNGGGTGTTADFEGIPTELAEQISKGIAAAVAPIAKQVADIAGTPVAGGPALSGNAGGNPGEGPRSGGADARTQFAPLREKIAKAEQAGDEAAAGELRKELGREVMREIFAQRGYDNTPSRQQRRAQYTPAGA